MALIFGFLSVVFTLCVLGLCVTGAIWETMRAKKNFKQLEQQWCRRQSQ
jgi:hypothetical protein